MNLQPIASPHGDVLWVPGSVHDKKAELIWGVQKVANRANAKLRALGERANAQLKAWNILTALRCCPWRAGKLAKASHALPLHGA